MTKHEIIQPSADSPLAIVSMVLGSLSIITIPTGFGLILGIPALITAVIALKKKSGGHGLSMTGLITGSISTATSALVILSMVVISFLHQTHPEYFQSQPAPTHHEDRFQSSRL